MPRIPKPAATRQRRNRSSTQAVLAVADREDRLPVPRLPRRSGGWHRAVLRWWVSVWWSPMASEYCGPDVRGGLFMLAELHQAWWESTTITQKLAIASEIRLQEVRFGLSPIDRRRLQWEIDKGETAEQRLSQRRAANSTTQPKPGQDPRELLKVG